MNISLPAGHVGESGLSNLMYLMYTHALNASSHTEAILLKNRTQDTDNALISKNRKCDGGGSWR